MKTGYIFHKRFIDHVLEPGHPESPERLVEIERQMAESGLDKKVVHLPFLDDPMPYIKMNHSDERIEFVKNIPGTGSIAELAVAGALGAVKAVSEGTVDNAFCALRPPGHHAYENRGEEGFCFYNNIAIAAKYAQSLGHKKILIIDWDYHHGNGTEHSFYSDPTVLFFSTHHWYAFPGSGDPSKKGSGEGKGFNINVPLDPGSTDTDIFQAWEKHLIPAANEFKPDFILISAGFDGRREDLLGCLAISDSGFYRLTKMAMEIAEKHCNGRIVSFLEGGYHLFGNAKAATTHVTALLEG
jgi:acetoin utilization deacetylase AcuC-like enzyme